jgi:hypothetical protein
MCFQSFATIDFPKNDLIERSKEGKGWGCHPSLLRLYSVIDIDRSTRSLSWDLGTTHADCGGESPSSKLLPERSLPAVVALSLREGGKEE